MGENPDTGANLTKIRAYNKKEKTDRTDPRTLPWYVGTYMTPERKTFEQNIQFYA